MLTDLHFGPDFISPNAFQPDLRLPGCRWFAVYRPCSSDSIRKMYGKAADNRCGGGGGSKGLIRR